MSTSFRLRQLSGSELRRLLVVRGWLRAEIVGAPRGVQRDVLRALEQARQYRLEGRARPWTPPAMTPDELVREIKWRIDTAPLAELSAGIRVLERGRRTEAARTGRRRQPRAR